MATVGNSMVHLVVYFSVFYSFHDLSYSQSDEKMTGKEKKISPPYGRLSIFTALLSFLSDFSDQCLGKQTDIPRHCLRNGIFLCDLFDYLCYSSGGRFPEKS